MDTVLWYVKGYVQNGNIFSSDTDYESFLATVQQCSQRYECPVYCYCLLPTSYHLMLEATEKTLGHCIRYVHQQYCRHGVHLTTSNKLSLSVEYTTVEKNVFAAELTLYIHALPYLSGIADMPSEYEWSSLSDYIHNSQEDTFIKSSPIVDQLCVRYFRATTEYKKRLMRFCSADVPIHISSGLERNCLGSKMFHRMLTRT